jgi:hypothetical protein
VVEGCLVDDGAFPRSAGEGVVHDGAGDAPALHGLDGPPFGAGKADAWESLAGREDDAAAAVVPGVRLVLAQDRELDPVNGLQLLQGEPQGTKTLHLKFKPANPHHCLCVTH